MRHLPEFIESGTLPFRGARPRALSPGSRRANPERFAMHNGAFVYTE